MNSTDEHEAWKRFKADPRERYRTAMRGPFTLRPTTNQTQIFNGKRWEIRDAKGKFVAGHIEKFALEQAKEKLDLLYAEWLMVRDERKQRCIILSCHLETEPGTLRCAFHAH